MAEINWTVWGKPAVVIVHRRLKPHANFQQTLPFDGHPEIVIRLAFESDANLASKLELTK
jgi:hypothetical protein